MTSPKLDAHTPGPWEFHPFDEDQTVIRPVATDSPNPLICTVSTGEGRPHGKANACLIAAAPDLLEACKALLGGDSTKARVQARAAIAKSHIKSEGGVR